MGYKYFVIFDDLIPVKLSFSILILESCRIKFGKKGKSEKAKNGLTR